MPEGLPLSLCLGRSDHVLVMNPDPRQSNGILGRHCSVGFLAALGQAYLKGLVGIMVRDQLAFRRSDD